MSPRNVLRPVPSKPPAARFRNANAASSSFWPRGHYFTPRTPPNRIRKLFGPFTSPPPILRPIVPTGARVLGGNTALPAPTAMTAAPRIVGRAGRAASTKKISKKNAKKKENDCRP